MKQNEKHTLRKAWIWGAAICAVIVVIVAIVCLTVPQKNGVPEDQSSVQPAVSGGDTDFEQGLHLVSIAPYSGPYVEDGSDESVENILSAIVRNDSAEPVQLTEITLTTTTGAQYSFTLTALPAGKQVTLLESNRSPYDENAVIGDISLSNIAGFDAPLSMHEELLQITPNDHQLRIKNVSGKDFAGGRVFYKSVSGGAYLGGITYMASIPSLAANEEISLYAGHYTIGSSELMFVTYAE